MTSSNDSLLVKATRFRNAYWPRYVFIHINKTAGSSIERALLLRFEHKTASEKKRELGAFRWRRAFKFTFVRNPWDKVVSHYNYRVKTNQTGMADRHISFRDWVLRAYGEHDTRYYDQPRMFMPQLEWICDQDGRSLVDFIGRYESLHDDFTTVCLTIGVRATLPHVKQSARPPYRVVYDTDSRECVRHVFCNDIDSFGYTF